MDRSSSDMHPPEQSPIAHTREDFTINVVSTGMDEGVSSGAHFRVRTTPVVEDPIDFPPFATLQGAIEDVASVIWHDVVIQLATGTFAGALISGFMGGGSRSTGEEVALTVVGNTSLSSGGGGGYTEFAAGAGTTTTSIAKAALGVNWAENALTGLLLVVDPTSGIGTTNQPVVRVIKSNSATALVVDTIPGMAEGVSVSIRDWDTTLSVATDDVVCLRVSDNTAPIRIRNLKFDGDGADYLLDAARNTKLVIDGCKFDYSTTETEAQLRSCQNVTLTNCVFSGGPGATIAKCQEVSASGLSMSATGTLSITDAGRVDAQITSFDALSTVLSIVRAQTAQVELYADNGAATPLYLESVADFTAVGTDLLTGTGNTGYGVEIQKAGRYVLTGGTITGASGDVNFMGNAVTWANLSSPTYGIAAENAGSAVASASYSKALTYGNRTYMGGVDISGRLLLFGYLNVSANTTVPALAAGEVLDMEAGTIDGVASNFGQIRGVIEVASADASAIVRLPSGALIAGVLAGVINTGAAAVEVEPPVGGTINGAASVTVAAGAARFFCSGNGNAGKDYFSLN